MSRSLERGPTETDLVLVDVTTTHFDIEGAFDDKYNEEDLPRYVAEGQYVFVKGSSFPDNGRGKVVGGGNGYVQVKFDGGGASCEAKYITLAPPVPPVPPSICPRFSKETIRFVFVLIVVIGYFSAALLLWEPWAARAAPPGVVGHEEGVTDSSNKDIGMWMIAIPMLFGICVCNKKFCSPGGQWEE
ncbi:hypothetical protein ScalyP_jg1056 [Parmales sp. scaly parma]|nr:hypothetical protein ScalyP_jg1056 [Parmales sp. scaly parma]